VGSHHSAQKVLDQRHALGKFVGDRDGRRYEESAGTDKWDTARDLLRTREGAITAGANASINLELANLKRIYTLAMQAGKVLQRPHVPMLK
jgi:hypothetical protein